MSFSETDAPRLPPLGDEEEDDAPSDMVAAAASSQMCLEERGSDTISKKYVKRNPKPGHRVTLYMQETYKVVSSYNTVYNRLIVTGDIQLDVQTV